jgi:hypothetical protein
MNKPISLSERILACLRVAPTSRSELARALGADGDRISKHLWALKESGFVRAVGSGLWALSDVGALEPPSAEQRPAPSSVELRAPLTIALSEITNLPDGEGEVRIERVAPPDETAGAVNGEVIPDGPCEWSTPDTEEPPHGKARARARDDVPVDPIGRALWDLSRAADEALRTYREHIDDPILTQLERSAEETRDLLKAWRLQEEAYP